MSDTKHKHSKHLHKAIKTMGTHAHNAEKAKEQALHKVPHHAGVHPALHKSIHAAAHMLNPINPGDAEAVSQLLQGNGGNTPLPQGNPDPSSALSSMMSPQGGGSPAPSAVPQSLLQGSPQ